MIKSISNWIAYHLFKLNIISEDSFTKVDYYIATALFGLFAVASYITIGYLMQQTLNVFICLVFYNLILNLENKSDFHARNSLMCGLFSGVGIFSTLLLSKIFIQLSEFGLQNIIFIVISAYVIINVTLSNKGKSLIRKIESIIYK